MTSVKEAARVDAGDYSRHAPPKEGSCEFTLANGCYEGMSGIIRFCGISGESGNMNI